MCAGAWASLGRAALLALVLIGLPGCFIASGSRGARPRVTVRGDADGDRPYEISAMTLPTDGGVLDAALDRVGAGLRISGSQRGLTIRHAKLDGLSLPQLLDALDLDEKGFSSSRSFAWGDYVEIESEQGGPPRVGSTIRLRPSMEHGTGMHLDLSAVVRPADGSLFPVLRGRVPVSGPGPLLIVGEGAERSFFALVVRLDVPGVARSGADRGGTPSTHRVEVEPFEGDSDVLSGVLERLSLSPGGTAGGFVIHRLSPRRLKEVGEAIGLACDRRGRFLRLLPSGGSARLPLPGAEVSLTTAFSPRDYSYRTTLEVPGRPGTGLRTEPHDEQEGLLLLLWDANGAGRSVAALLRIRPVE